MKIFYSWDKDPEWGYTKDSKIYINIGGYKYVINKTRAYILICSDGTIIRSEIILYEDDFEGELSIIRKGGQFKEIHLLDDGIHVLSNSVEFEGELKWCILTERIKELSLGPHCIYFEDTIDSFGGIPYDYVRL